MHRAQPRKQQYFTKAPSGAFLPGTAWLTGGTGTGMGGTGTQSLHKSGNSPSTPSSQWEEAIQAQCVMINLKQLQHKPGRLDQAGRADTDCSLCLTKLQLREMGTVELSMAGMGRRSWHRGSALLCVRGRLQQGHLVILKVSAHHPV